MRYFGSGPQIFISYRRSDSTEVVKELYSILVARYGEPNVFLDKDTLHGGEPYPLQIEKWIAQSTIFVLVIGKEWLSAVDEGGRQRLAQADDWVRIELRAALLRRPPRLTSILHESRRKRGRSLAIIPCYVNGADAVVTDSLPEDLRGLRQHTRTTVWHNSGIGITIDAQIDRITRMQSNDARAELWKDAALVPLTIVLVTVFGWIVIAPYQAAFEKFGWDASLNDISGALSNPSSWLRWEAAWQVAKWPVRIACAYGIFMIACGTVFEVAGLIIRRIRQF